jgi:CTP-dependent riboflavin kinase
MLPTIANSIRDLTGMKKTYNGEVFTGIGVAKTRVAENLEAYKQATGMDLLPGTLNVRLTERFVVPSHGIYIPPDRIKPIESNRGITLIEAVLDDEKVIIMYPDRPIYEPNVIEIMAPFNLRNRFRLKDGDEVHIEVAG